MPFLIVRYAAHASLFYTVFCFNLYLISIWGLRTLNGFLCFSFVFDLVHKDAYMVFAFYFPKRDRFNSHRHIITRRQGMLVLLSGVYLIAWKIARGERHCPVWSLSNIYHYVLNVHLLLDSLRIPIQWILS